MPPVSVFASAYEENTVLRVLRSVKIGPFGVGLPFIIIRNGVCKVIVIFNVTTVFLGNEISGICVCHQNHIARVITYICVWVG